jgi:hypothetical protein
MTSAVPSSSSRHRGRRAALTALLAGALIAGGTVVATTVAAPAGASTNPFADMVTIETSGNTTAAKFYGANRSVAPTVQTLNGRNCAIAIGAASVSGPVMRLDATLNGVTSNVGVNAGSIGAAERSNSNGQSCGQVNTGTTLETLSIDLAGRAASTAVLDIEVQKNVVVKAIATVGGVAEVFYLYTGTSQIPDPAPTGAVTTCKKGETSSAPNSNSADNCKWQITPTGTFTSLELTTAEGSPGQFSLEGGSDWTGGALAGSGGFPTNATYFWFGEVVQCRTGEVTVDGDATTPTVTIRDISTSSGSCQGFAFDLTTSGGKASFIKPWSEQSQRLQFMMDLEWQIPAGSSAELPEVFFGFHDINLNEGTARELGWCADTEFSTTAPFLATGIVTNPATATPSMDVETNNTLYPGVQYACMADSKVIRDSNNKPIGWFQSIYVHGDAFARR